MKHVKHLLRITPKFVHGMVLGAIVGILVVVSLRGGGTAQALSISSARDCDTNAVIHCGALTTSELQKRYSNAGVATIYSYFGISSSDIKAMGTTAVAGRVYRNGAVTVHGKTVATGAVTAGRHNITGSIRVKKNGVTFYVRPPSVSFVPSSLAAFVVMQNGQFKFAILGSCGNPVRATAIPKPKPTPTPTTPTPTTPTTTAPKPIAQAKPKVTTTASVKSLPNTGPGAIVVIAILSLIGGYVSHMTHRHIRHRRHARQHAAR